MDWIKPFFDTASHWWGRPRPAQKDQERVATLERLCGPGPHRVLELGAGGGTTAAATADRGHSVVAVELSAVRAGFIADLAVDSARDLTVVEGDFYHLDLGDGFDCVAYWNGFGVGTDSEQRRLLRRIAGWLAPGGRAIIDVMSPWHWARIAGQTVRVRHVIDLVNYNDYDPITSRYLDRWWPEGREEEAVTQYGRCYSPAEFHLLLEGTGLRVHRLELGDLELAVDDGADHESALWDAWEYRAILVRDE